MTADSKMSTASKEDESLPSIDQRNWRGIGISLLVIMCISSLIALAILLLSPRGLGERVNQERFYLEDVVNGNFTARKFNGTWISDNELIFLSSEGHLVRHRVLKSPEILVQNISFSDSDFQAYSVSPNSEFVLLTQNVHKVFRYSYEARYFIFQISIKKTFPLNPPSKPGALLQMAAWGPKASQLVYVFQNNLYYLPQVNGTHKEITLSGRAGVIFNGVPDWLYEEEILQSNKAFWWSFNGSYLCYASFNDSLVDSYYYSWYGAYDDKHSIYPELRDLRYPKAGRNIPTVTLWIADVSNLSKIVIREVKPPRDIQNQDFYLSTLSWIDVSKLVVVWMRRTQNYTSISLCEAPLWHCNTISKVALLYRKGWVDISEPPIAGPRSGVFFMKLPDQGGPSGTYRHVAMLDYTSQQLEYRPDFLTRGEYDVTRIVGYSEANNTVFYEATTQGRPGERHLYSVTATKNVSQQVTHCLTCDLPGIACFYNQAHLSPSAGYYILDCLGPEVPRVEIRSTDNSTLVEVLDENSDLRYRMDHRAMPQIRTFQVPISGSGGYKAQVRLFLPPGLADDEAILYPLVVQSYAGPGSQLVSERFEIHWGTYLSSRRNYIYAWVDGRGSGFQGDKMQQELYYKLGTLEVKDQIEITRYLRDNLPFVDPAHIAIWGTSYGGYVAAMAMAEDEEPVFKCGIAVAPITNWLYYDAAYSERYMGTPKPDDNYIGYERASLLNKASLLKGKRFLLVHGTADDNVHFQHTMMFVKHLKDENVLFQLQVYPDENHYLSSVKHHLYTTMEDFLKECFYVEPKDELEATRVKKDVKGR